MRNVVALDENEVVIKKSELESYQFAKAVLSKILRFQSCVTCSDNKCIYRVKDGTRFQYPRVNCINWRGKWEWEEENE